MITVCDDASLLGELDKMVSQRSLAAVGEDLGFSAGFVSNVLNGKRDMTVGLAAAIGYDPAPRGWIKRKKVNQISRPAK